MAGSNTRGAAAYDESYADTRSWVQLGLLDYIAPQLYWPFARDAARYDVLAKMVGECGDLHQYASFISVLHCIKLGSRQRTNQIGMVNGGVLELQKQLDLNESVSQIKGTILFRENYLNQPQTQQAVNYLKKPLG
ncbi:Uncharacterized protein conserved in bacteria [Serratia fonticola]|uniref:Uncharacterized protein conserved in bacteria n=1 Tax=Serratia fonticola TaxID=47917 RepID=A0A4U9TUQ3_SERFO|nr:Uncharacterized protein conserved in bacteria [Serratia fonticola]